MIASLGAVVVVLVWAGSGAAAPILDDASPLGCGTNGVANAAAGTCT
jgi:hypothetical protein